MTLFRSKKSRLPDNNISGRRASAKKYFHAERPDGELLISIDILIALSPLLIWSIYLYGLRPVVIAAVSAVSALILDYLVLLAVRRKGAPDLSAAVSGVLIALFMPASAPLWLPLFTSAIAVTVKNINRSLHRVVVNPALIPLLVCLIAFPDIMAAVPKAGTWLDPFALSVSGFDPAETDAITTVMSGFLPNISAGEMFFGMRDGMIGEASAFLILAGGIYLCSRKIFKALMPLSYIAAIAIIAYLQPTLTAASDMVALKGALYHILGANTFLCAVYLTQDHETIPNHLIGSLIAGIIGGSVTVLLRSYVSIELSALLGILAMNVMSPALSLLFRRAPFGGYIKPELFDRLVNKEDKQ